MKKDPFMEPEVILIEFENSIASSGKDIVDFSTEEINIDLDTELFQQPGS